MGWGCDCGCTSQLCYELSNIKSLTTVLSLKKYLASRLWPTAAVGLNLLYGQSREVIKALHHSFSAALQGLLNLVSMLG